MCLLFDLIVQIVKRVRKIADAVDKAAGDRLLSVYHAADIVCKLVGRHHQLVILLAAYIRVACHEAYYALLNARKIVICLRNTDDNAV